MVEKFLLLFTLSQKMFSWSERKKCVEKKGRLHKKEGNRHEIHRKYTRNITKSLINCQEYFISDSIKT